jgi:hypothetical protein
MSAIPAAAGRVSSADSGVEHVLIQMEADIMEYTAGGAQPPSAEERSAGELVKLLSDQVSMLARDELKLAQPEVTRK